MPEYDNVQAILKQACPTAIFRPQPTTDWQGEFRLPSAVAEYFTELGPVDILINGYGNPYFLPSLSKLWAYQKGYRTHGLTGERISDWDKDWLVIADEGGDPFIFSRVSGAILHAFHGEGAWKPIQIFENLPEMIAAFAIIGDIVASAGRGLTDSDSMLLPEHQEAARRRICELLHSKERADSVVPRLGWS